MRMFRARKSKRGVTRFLARFLLVNAVALSFVIVLSGRTFRGDGERTRLGHGLGDADAARPALRSASVGFGRRQSAPIGAISRQKNAYKYDCLDLFTGCDMLQVLN